MFRALFQYRREPHYLAALLAARPLTDETALVLSYAVTHAGNPDEWDGWLEALIEDAERDAAHAPPAQRAALAQLALMRKLKLGLTSEAVEGYLAYPVEIRVLLPLRPKACAEADEVCELVREAAFELADELTAALGLQGHRQHAVALLQGWRDSAGPGSFNAAQRHAALAEAMAPGLSKDALFTLFVEGRRPNDPRLDIGQIPAGRTASSPGWLFSVRFAGAALSEIVAVRLRLAGYESMADFLVGGVLYGRPDGSGPGLGRDFSFLLPERLAARQAYWTSRIETVWMQREAQRVKTRTPGGTPPRTPWWIEQPLPRHVRAWA